MAAERWDAQVGSVADEASRLLESLRRSAAAAAAATAGRPEEAEHGPDAGAGAGPGDQGADPVDAPAGAPVSGSGAAHDPFCTWCPLCRGAAVVRSLSPETLARLADLATLAATVLTEIASSRPAGGPAASGGAPGHGAGPDDDASRPAAQSASGARRRAPAPSRPIPVSDADDPQEAPRG